jgi:predicted GNAT family N-acyltransferase
MPRSPCEIHLDTTEYHLAFELRRDVLLDPFGVDYDQARSDDAAALHFGIFDERRCLATLLLVSQDQAVVKMRQVAVADSSQGQGWGRTLTQYAEGVARDHGFEKVVAHARAQALPFYLALGYQAVGEAFVEVGIVHHLVQKVL